MSYKSTYFQQADIDSQLFSHKSDDRSYRRKRSSRLLSRGQSIEYVALFSEPNIAPPQQQAEVVHEHQDYGLLTRKVISVSEKEWNKCLERRNKLRQRNRLEGRSIFGLPTMHPTAAFVVYWAIVMLLVDVIYTAYFLPIDVAFKQGDNVQSWRDIFDMIVDCIYICDFLLSFHVGYIIMYNGQKTTAMEGRNILYFYFYNGSFWIDLVTLLSCAPQFATIFLDFSQDRLRYILLGLSAAKMLRLIRVVWIIKISYQTALFALEPMDLQIFTNSIYQMLNILYCLSTIVNLLGCFFYFIAKLGPDGISGSWVASQGLLDAPSWQCYLASIYFTLATVSTVGYGDIHPVTWLEQIAAIFVILIGLVFFAFLIGMVTEFLQITSRRMNTGQMYKDKMEMVSEWVNTRGFSPPLRNDIYRFYSVLASFDNNPDVHFIEELPMQLKSKALYEMILPIVDFVPVLQNIPDQVLKQFASRLQPINPAPGGDLCREGDLANCVWLLLDGVIGVSRFQRELHEIHAPAFLGDGVILGDQLQDVGKRRLCTFTCKTVCRVMQMAGVDLMYVMQLHPPMKDALLAKLRRFVDKCLNFFPLGDPQLETVQNYIDQQMIRPKIESTAIFDKEELKGILSPQTLTPTVSLATNWAEDNIQEHVQLLLNGHAGSDNELQSHTTKSLNRNIKRAISDPKGNFSSLTRFSQY